MILAVVVGLGGAFGAVSRYLVDGAVQDRSSGPLPFGTISVNLIGSFVMGLVVGLFVFSGFHHAWVAVVGTGFCGGLTTWSSASFETIRLFEERQIRAGLVTAVGGFVLSFALAGAGFLLAYGIGR
jgi:fluoride exporter